MHNCETCVKSFSCERALNRHLASKGHLLRESKEKKTYSCHCGKTFFQCAGLSRHKKKCSVPKPSLQAESLEEQMKKMREDFEREKEEMKAQYLFYWTNKLVYTIRITRITRITPT